MSGEGIKDPSAGAAKGQILLASLLAALTAGVGFFALSHRRQKDLVAKIKALPSYSLPTSFSQLHFTRTPTLPTPGRFLTPRPRQSMNTTTQSNFVTAMQSALARAGFSPGGIDGGWGSKTSAAAAAFQNANNMAPTGLPEPALAQALGVAAPPVPGRLGPSFVPTLVQQVAGICAPLDALKMMMHESGLNPASAYRIVLPHGPKTNSLATDGTISIVACGLFGLLTNVVQGTTSATHVIPLLGMTTDQFMALSATQQLPFAARFWRSLAMAKPVSGRDLYWNNFLPDSYVQGAGDSLAFVKDNDTYLSHSRGQWVPYKGVYSMNSGLDHGHKGYITTGDMKLALDEGAFSDPATYAACAAAMQSLGVA